MSNFEMNAYHLSATYSTHGLASAAADSLTRETGKRHMVMTHFNRRGVTFSVTEA